MESKDTGNIIIYHLLDGRVRCGASTVTKKLVEALQSRGCDVTLCFLYPGPVLEDAIGQGLPVRLLPGGNFLTILRAIIRMCRDEMAKGGRVILHTHQLRANRFASMASAWTRCHHIISIHTHKELFIRDWFHSPLKRFFIRKVHYLTLNHADALVAVSKGVHRELIERGYPPEKVRLIHNTLYLPEVPIDSEAFRTSVCQETGIPLDSFIAVTAGRFVPLKRFDLSIRATSILSQEINLCLLIAGDGPLRKKLEDYADRLHVSKNIRFLGWKNDLSRFLSAADCVISCSNTECSPVFLIEALAIERPIIAAAAEDVIHLVQDKQTGFLFPLGDISGLCNALREVARDPERAQAMAKTGRRVVKNQFDTDASVRKILEMYAQVTNSTNILLNVQQ